MTVCNMTIEAGARAGMIAPDETTFALVDERGVEVDPAWAELYTEEGAHFDKEIVVDASAISPKVTWGTNPAQVAPVTAAIRHPRRGRGACAGVHGARGRDADRGDQARPRLHRLVHQLAHRRPARRGRDGRGQKVARRVRDGRPGLGKVKEQAEAEGLDKIFTAAGFDWRGAGCSMCLAMNPDKLEPGERCASTTNRNFEGRQGKGGRTHLVCPAMAAAAAVAGHFVDIRNWK